MLPDQSNDQILTKNANHRLERIRQFSKHHSWKTKKGQELAETVKPQDRKGYNRLNMPANPMHAFCRSSSSLLTTTFLFSFARRKVGKWE